MAITSIDGLVTALPGQYVPALKVTPTLQTVGQWYSPWLLAGIPGAGTAPSAGVAGVAVDDAVNGGMVFTNPGSGLSYLYHLGLGATSATSFMLYDRLWHNSGLSPTTLTAQTVNSVTLPSRSPVVSDPTGETFDTNGGSVEAWFDVMTVLGAGTTPPSISYTDEAGNSGSTGTCPAFTTASAVGRCYPFSRTAGDRGVKSIQTYTNGATLTSGTFSLVLRRRLAILPGPLVGLQMLDFSQVGMPAIPDDAHLEILVVATVTTGLTIHGGLTVVQG